MTVVTCISCGLRQFALSSACRRCRADLGFSFIEIPLTENMIHSQLPGVRKLLLGSLIRSIRLRQGKSQARISEKAETGRAHLSRIERGAATPNLATLLRILGALGVESLYVRLNDKSP